MGPPQPLWNMYPGYPRVAVGFLWLAGITWRQRSIQMVSSLRTSSFQCCAWFPFGAAGFHILYLDIYYLNIYYYIIYVIHILYIYYILCIYDSFIFIFFISPWFNSLHPKRCPLVPRCKYDQAGYLMVAGTPGSDTFTKGH